MIEETTNELTFAELLEEYEPHPVQQGDYRTGEILRIDEEYAILDIGAKQEAVASIQELTYLHDHYGEELTVGDQVPVAVEKVPALGDRLIVSIQKGMEEEDWSRANEYLESQEHLDLKVTGYNKGGLLVQFRRLTGFIPNSHVPELRRAPDEQRIKAQLVGQVFPLQVLQVEPARQRLVFTGRATVEVRRQQCLDALQVGETIKGIVKNIVPYGVFVDVGGADGLVHISELAWRHLKHPSEVLKTGDEVAVMVQEINHEQGRVSLSRKALLPNPWQQFAQQNPVNTLLEGVVTNVQEYGVFVKLNEQIAGLLHVSEVDTASGGNPKEMFRPGDKILVRIIEIKPDDGRVRLSTRRVTYQEMADWAAQNWTEKPPSEETLQETASQQEAAPQQEAPLENEPEQAPIAQEQEPPTVEPTPSENALPTPSDETATTPDVLAETSTDLPAEISAEPSTIPETLQEAV